MKKIIIAIVSVALVLGLASCSKKHAGYVGSAVNLSDKGLAN